MFDEYFNEFDPVTRKEILDNLQPEAGEEVLLEQVRTLFTIRYKPNKKGGYDDKFIAYLMSFHYIAEKRGQTERGRNRYGREIQKEMHALCLDRTDEFSPIILYKEIYQLIYLYISSCMEDHHFGSVLFGIGHMKEPKIVGKIQEYMLVIRDLVAEYAQENEGYQILVNAINDVINEKLGIEIYFTEDNSDRSIPRKIDERS